MDKLQQAIAKAIPVPTCPTKKLHAEATREWLRREIIKIYGPVPVVGPSVLK